MRFSKPYIRVYQFTLGLFLISCFACESDSNYSSAVLIQNGFSFTEGPASDGKGNVYFTDQPNNKIYVYRSSTETIDEFATNTGRSNGLYIDGKGKIWACADSANQIVTISEDGRFEVILNHAGKNTLFNGPNDIWIHNNGKVFFTDPMYQRNYWADTHDTLSSQSVYVYIPEKDSLTVIDESLQQPNGIIGNAETGVLYVADIAADKTYKYRLSKNGEVQSKSLFCEQGSDGMTLDRAGNVYLTGKGVTVYNAEGEKIHQIDIPEEWTANITFFGEENDQLFITAKDGVYKVKTIFKGL